MPLIEEVLAEAGTPLATLDAIGVGVGPGNFTGIRIAVAAARGLALALGIPAIGVTTFEAMRGPDGRLVPAPQLVSLPGPRDGYLLQLFEGGTAKGPPHAVPGLDQVDRDALGVTGRTEILGHDADRLAAVLRQGAAADAPGPSRRALPQGDLAGIIGRIAVSRFTAGEFGPRPAPVYVRPADAAPARESGPTILPC
jgi:tRNA threonylcarbamoyladenosine biosynthesis protein TsaB